jgi:hypothetical protein
MDTAERIARLTTYASKIRGIDRCLANIRRNQGWGEESQVIYWLDQGELYAGLLSVEEFNARH